MMRLFLKSVFIENFIEFTVLYSWGQIVIIVYDIFWERHQPKNKLHLIWMTGANRQIRKKTNLMM